MSPFASSSKISGTGIFRVVPTETESGPFMAAQLIKSYKTMAVITEKTDFAFGVRDALVPPYELSGGKVVSSETFDSGTSDFSSLIQKVKVQNPDIIFINPQSGASGARLVKQLREMGITTQVAAFFITGEDFISEPASEGTIIFDAPGLSTNADAQKFSSEYVAKYGKVSYPFAAGSAYDILHVLNNAITSSGESKDQIVKYLIAMKPYQGLVGTFTFDKSGDVKGLGYTTLRVKDKGLIPFE
jgi:branched-chain amino acid transport system substrate-binding protein